MKHILKILFLLIPLLAFAGGERVMNPLQKLLYAEQFVAKYYVDPIDTTKVVEEGIKGMLKALDPHSTYTTAEETRELNEPLEGNFSGIGVRFQMTHDTLYVIEATVGGPSEKAGILPGDRILMCNDSVISGGKLKNSEIMKRLRGPKGSKAVLKVMRGRETMTFNLTRDDIPINSIEGTFMANDSIGYITISRFGASTAKEMAEAIRNLRSQGMRHLIIDLSGNGGGYLRAATDICGMFLDKGDLIVFTDSPQNGRQEYRSSEKPLFPEGNVVVITNQYSASASEILAGAIQDNDRGVVVGRRSFGKGLVQRPFTFPDGSMVRLTVSRYHTPSGRCIQKPYTSGDDDDYNTDMLTRYRSGELMHADSVHRPDSLLYRTLRLGRPVYGGGGIMPDEFVALDTTYFTPYYRGLLAKGITAQYALQYVDTHRAELKKNYPTPEQFTGRFEITPDMLADLRERAVADSVKFTDTEYELALPLVTAQLKGLIGRDIFDQAIYYRIVNPLMPEYSKALEILATPGKYEEYFHKSPTD